MLLYFPISGNALRGRKSDRWVYGTCPTVKDLERRAAKGKSDRAVSSPRFHAVLRVGRGTRSASVLEALLFRAKIRGIRHSCILVLPGEHSAVSSGPWARFSGASFDLSNKCASIIGDLIINGKTVGRSCSLIICVLYLYLESHASVIFAIGGCCLYTRVCSCCIDF
jgi:hypothetical protein